MISLCSGFSFQPFATNVVPFDDMPAQWTGIHPFMMQELPGLMSASSSSIEATRYRLVGVGLSNFQDPAEYAVQARLFEAASSA